MLSYLDSLCSALVARDQARIFRLLEHPLARALPAAVREEAREIADIGPHSARAPIQAMRFYHQTAHLLGVVSDPARGTSGAGTDPAGGTGGVSRDGRPSRDANSALPVEGWTDPQQMELPLRSRTGVGRPGRRSG